MTGEPLGSVLIIGSGAMAIASARRAAEHGAHVSLSSRSQSHAEAAAAEAGASVRSRHGDPEDPMQAEALLLKGAPWDHVASSPAGPGPGPVPTRSRRPRCPTPTASASGAPCTGRSRPSPGLPPWSSHRYESTRSARVGSASPPTASSSRIAVALKDIADAFLSLALNPAITAAVLDVDGGERLGTYSA